MTEVDDAKMTINVTPGWQATEQTLGARRPGVVRRLEPLEQGPCDVRGRRGCSKAWCAVAGGIVST